LEFVTYQAGTSGDGTYFMNINLVEIQPALEDGYYGSPITITATPSKIQLGQNTTLSGVVSGATEAMDITIQYRKQENVWTNLTTLSTNTSGHFSQSWKPSETGVFNVRAIGVVEDRIAESAVISVTVESPFDPMLYVYIAVPIVIVVVVILILLLRRRGSKAKEEIPPS
jgi:hypothetical protein